MFSSIYQLFDTVHLRFSLILKTLLLIGAIALFMTRQYQAMMETLIILSITFLPIVLHARFQVKIPHEFETLAILFVCLSLFFGEVLDFYNRYWWWDIVLHTSSGFLLGITGFLLVYVLNEDEAIDLDLTPGFISMFAFMFAMGLGALWEIFEYTMDELFGLNMQKSGLRDTMWDLIVDAIGALLISLMGYKYLQTIEKDSFLEQWINNFVSANPQFFSKTKKPEPDQNDS